MVEKEAHDIRLYASGFPLTILSKKNEYSEVIVNNKKAVCALKGRLLEFRHILANKTTKLMMKLKTP